MDKNKAYRFAVLLILLSIFISSIVSYPYMPSKMAIHWNESGSPDGYASKEIALSIIPVASALLSLLFIAIPWIDPMKRNIQQFISYYYGMVIVFLLFMLLMNISMCLSNVSINVITQAVMIGISAMMLYIGILLKHAKMNWFVGIRTPWTLSSEEVWKKTHAIGSRMFIILAIIIFISIFLPYNFLIIFTSTMFVAAFLIVYSYYEYRKLHQ